MIRKIIGIVCFTAMITQAGAQGLDIGLNAGLQGMHYPLQNGQVQQLPGGSLGLNYTFRLGTNWGLLTGITGGLYRTQASLQNGVVFTSDQVDDAGSAFRYSIKTEGYKETQQFFAASIPLLVQYHTDGIGKQWYFDVGGKVFFPFNTSIQASAKQLSVSGYYPDFNLEVSNLPQHGFGTINGWKSSATSELKPAAALSAATGVSFRLSSGMRLYTGLYIDYGLTSLKEKNGSMPLATYSTTGTAGVKANSVLNTANAGEATLLSFGLQLRLSLGSARAKPAAQPKPSVRSKTAVQPPPATQSTPIAGPPPAAHSTPAARPTPIAGPPPSAQPPKKKESPPPDISDDTLELIQRPVLFGIPGETAVSEVQKQRLDEVADILKQYPNIRIAIAGHTCNSDQTTENKKVGTARARSVADYLRSKGIDRSRMDVSPDSESHPYLSYDPAANYRNRRAVITVE